MLTISLNVFQGTDAAAFLNLVYTNAWLKLEIGRCPVARQHEVVAPATDQQGERDAEATEKT